MLRSYGRLLTSSPLRGHVTSILKPKPPRTILTTVDVSIRRYATGTEAPSLAGLADRQAALEASGYDVRKAARKLKKDSAPPKAAEKPKKRARVSPKIAKTANAVTTKAKVKRQAKTKAHSIPARLLPPKDQKHNDLASFLQHAEQNSLNVDSTTYKGTHFEYTVAESLKAFNFTLYRTGRSNDLGIDFIGHWSLPHSPAIKKQSKQSAQELPVLVQCKATKQTPAMVRELEGAYTGAPAGWHGDGVVALLASTHPATKGVRAAVQRSRCALGVLQVTREGEVKQFVWNAVAAQAGLEGLGVAVKYSEAVADEVKNRGVESEGGAVEAGAEVGSAIGLTWMGKMWRPLSGEPTITPATK